ncbi:hypothetical protein [Foetidibacter luteolus]|uniref:hypothetical protein n=1 Tax=Foetidibacter luteolus TaxID=2608880 RepID=UPI00129B737A|nr:hypothetical protein [Foetidibacter luteolus]
MLKQPGALPFLVRNAVLIAIISSFPMIYFIRQADFSQIWLLYLGDVVFLGSIFFVMMRYNRRIGNNNTPVSLMLIAGHILTILSISVFCLIAFILITVYVPGLFSSGHAEKELVNAPANMVEDKTNGLLFIVFMNAAFGNFSAGSFATIITAYISKRNQKSEQGSM